MCDAGQVALLWNYVAMLDTNVLQYIIDRFDLILAV